MYVNTYFWVFMGMVTTNGLVAARPQKFITFGRDRGEAVQIILEKFQGEVITSTLRVLKKRKPWEATMKLPKELKEGLIPGGWAWEAISIPMKMKLF